MPRKRKKKANKTRTETCKNDVVMTAQQQAFKGQEISKGNFGVIVSPKIRAKIFLGFPSQQPLKYVESRIKNNGFIILKQIGSNQYDIVHLFFDSTHFRDQLGQKSSKYLEISGSLQHHRNFMTVKDILLKATQLKLRYKTNF